MTSDNDDISEEALAALREAHEQELEGLVHAVGSLQKKLDIYQLVFTLQPNGNVDASRFVSTTEHEKNWRRIDRVNGHLIDPKTNEVRIEGFRMPRDE